MSATCAPGTSERDPGVAGAERAEAVELLGELLPEALAADDRVDRLAAHPGRRRQGRRDRVRERLPERLDAAGLDLEPRGGPVAAVAAQVLGAGVERAEQVEARHAARRAPSAAVRVESDQDHRAVVALDHPRGDDPDHARVPALAREHQPGRLAESLRELGAGALGARQHLALDFATLAVDAVELGGDLRRPSLVVGEQQLDPGVGAIEAAGGVDPRPEPEREVALVEALGRQLRRRDQRPQAGSAGTTRLGDPAPHQGPVLPSQRHQVGDRRQRDQVELGLDRRRPAQRRCQLVGDPGPAELAERVAGDDRVQDRAPGQLRARLMVVGDDHLQPGAERRLDLGDGADPAVGGQQQRGAALGQLGDGRLGEPVAVLEPAGDQPVALGA